MTMRKIGFFAALVVAMTAVSCVEDINTTVPQNGEKTFQATFDATASKAVLKPDATESKVEWNKNDQVSVLVGENNYMYVAQADGLSTTLTTSATGVPAEGTFYAIYPYDESATLTDGVVTTSLPASQTAVKGSFATHLAVAQTTSNNLAFKNVCGLVKVNVSSDNVTSIVFAGNSGEIVAGAINVAVTDAPAWTAVAEQGDTTVTLLPAAGKSVIEAGDYYFAVLPQTFAAGFKVTAHKNDGYAVVRNVETEVTVARAGIVAGKSFGISGQGTEAAPYVIMTAQDMVDMRTLAKLGGETWFKLGADIDMKGVTNYEPVNYDENFERKIHFDGDNHTISNFSSNFKSYPSLFGVLYGSVKNLKVTNAAIEATSVAGIVAGYAGTTGKPAQISNVQVQGTVTSTTNRCGGFAGNSVNAEFTDCSADVTVSGTYDVAGFVGKAQQTLSLVRCEAKVNVTATNADKNRGAGLVGWLNTTTASFENCKVLAGSVIEDKSTKTASTVAMYGGIVAYAGSTEATTIKNCSVEATFNTANCQSVAGLVALVSGGGNITIEGCQFKGSAIGSNQVAGVLAYSESAKNITVTDTHVDATITGGTATNMHYCCGLLGNIASAETVTLKRCSAAGEAGSGGSSNAGLIGAQTNGTAVIEDCYATCSITGNTNNGGLLGNMGVPATVKNCYFKGPKIASNNGNTGGIVGNSNVTLMENCYAETNISAKTSNVGGLIGAQSCNITITGCHFSGDILVTEANVGGIIGRSTAAISTVSKCYTTGSVKIDAAKNNGGGIFGYATAFVLTDSWSSMDVYTKGQSVGGIVGTAGAPCVLRNCFATGDITGRSAGGVVGMSYTNADGSVFENSIFWGNVTNVKSTSTQYSGGAIIGCANTKKITAKNCWRGAAVTLTDFSGVFDGDIMYNNVLVDNDDVVNDLPPVIAGIPSDHTAAYAQRPYHGKAAAANATISSIAKTLGWDETIWDLSGAVPVLK